MLKPRTRKQTAFDGVRVAWRVPVELAQMDTGPKQPLSVDGVRFDRVHTAYAMREKLPEAIPSSMTVSSNTVTGTIHTWMRSMDGVRMQPRLQ